MTDTPKDTSRLAEAELDALFDVASSAAPDALSADMTARLMQDALASMPEAVQIEEAQTAANTWPATPVPQMRRAKRPSFWEKASQLFADFGGAPGFAGMGVAGLAGVWIGFAGPGQAGELVSSFWQGAASVNPTVSTWIESGDLGGDASGMLSLLSGVIE